MMERAEEPEGDNSKVAAMPSSIACTGGRVYSLLLGHYKDMDFNTEG